MKIQVLGSGCPTCKNLYELTKVAVNELKISADVEYIDDISKIIEMGIIQSPVLVVDGKVVMTGSGDIKKIKEAITQNNDSTPTKKESCCSCGGKC